MAHKNGFAIFNYKGLGFTQGLAITMFIAIAAKYISMLPFFKRDGSAGCGDFTRNRI